MSAPTPSGADEIAKVFQFPAQAGRAPRSAPADEGSDGESSVVPLGVDEVRPS